jgi:hypothetical protein
MVNGGNDGGQIGCCEREECGGILKHLWSIIVMSANTVVRGCPSVRREVNVTIVSLQHLSYLPDMKYALHYIFAC